MTDLGGGAPAQSTKVFSYISRPAPGLTIDDVRDLVFAARGFNAMNGVSGFLACDHRGFMQAIEGTVETLDKLAARIAADTRHRDMQCLFDAAVPSRQFYSFHDFVAADGQLASLAALPRSSQDHLSPEVRAAIERGFSSL